MRPERSPRKDASSKSSKPRSSPKSLKLTKSRASIKPTGAQGLGRSRRDKQHGRSKKPRGHSDEPVRTSNHSTASPGSAAIASRTEPKQKHTAGERSTTSGERRGLNPPSGKSSSLFSSLKSVRGQVSGRAKIWMAVLAVIVLGAVLFMLVRLARRRPPIALRISTCQSKSCQRYKELLKDAVDFSSDPCNNYYAYVCSVWTKSHEKSVQTITLEHFINDAVEGLKSLPAIDDPITRKGTLFFSACLSVTEKSNVPGVRKLLADGGIVWPNNNTNPDFLNALFYMSRVLFVPVLFHFSVYSHGKVLKVGHSDEFDDRLLTLRRHIKTRHLHRHLTVVYRAFGAIDEDRLEEIVQRFNHLEQFIDVYFNSSQVNGTESDASTTYATESFLRLTPSVPRARWDTVLKRYFAASIADLHFAVVENRKQFEALVKIHQDYGEAELNDLVESLCVQSLVRFTSFEIISSYYESSDVAAVWLQKECFLTAFTFFGYDVNRYFASKRGDAVGRLKGLAERVRRAFLAALKDSENYTARTQSDHHERRNDISEHHFRNLFASLNKSQNRAYRDQYASYPNLTDDPLQNWKILNEYYYENPQMAAAASLAFSEKNLTTFRHFALLIQHLSFPYYEPDAHKGAVLGGLGARIAAAMFYDYAESRDRVSKFYRRNQDCLGLHAGSYPDYDLQGAVAAVPVVYAMFTEARKDYEDVLVQDLPPFLADSIPFMFACYLLCGEENGETMCNVPLKHSVDFAFVYKCKPGSPMNPREKCAMIP
ncbi:hypothetical protein HPB50_015231 [Hyalomma asiaticum]|uniref:Uncharacterized protein n=1 Tax=Hyalomma asiaticum TaxID=266040 RepID=A0ACB7SMU9_HYAAI|nr:hypothetical protein HPB50_015231 [Hyalomma asiaticum]